MPAEEIKIPYGFKRVFGQLQKGDGLWNGTRFAKVKKQYPNTDERIGLLFAIRRCEVEQAELLRIATPEPMEID